MTGSADERSVEYVLHLTCSDAGQHPERHLPGGRVAWWSTGARQVGATVFDHPDDAEQDRPLVGDRGRLLGVIPPAPDASPRTNASRAAYRFSCRHCRRTPERKRAEFWILMDAARRAGMLTFDLSRLD